MANHTKASFDHLTTELMLNVLLEMDTLEDLDAVLEASSHASSVFSNYGNAIVKSVIESKRFQSISFGIRDIIFAVFRAYGGGKALPPCTLTHRSIFGNEWKHERCSSHQKVWNHVTEMNNAGPPPPDDPYICPINGPTTAVLLPRTNHSLEREFFFPCGLLDDMSTAALRAVVSAAGRVGTLTDNCFLHYLSRFARLKPRTKRHLKGRSLLDTAEEPTFVEQKTISLASWRFYLIHEVIPNWSSVKFKDQEHERISLYSSGFMDSMLYTPWRAWADEHELEAFASVQDYVKISNKHQPSAVYTPARPILLAGRPRNRMDPIELSRYTRRPFYDYWMLNHLDQHMDFAGLRPFGFALWEEHRIHEAEIIHGKDETITALHSILEPHQRRFLKPKPGFRTSLRSTIGAIRRTGRRIRTEPKTCSKNVLKALVVVPYIGLFVPFWMLAMWHEANLARNSYRRALRSATDAIRRTGRRIRTEPMTFSKDVLKGLILAPYFGAYFGVVILWITYALWQDRKRRKTGKGVNPFL